MDTNYSAQNGEIGVDAEPTSGIGSQLVGVFTSPVKAFKSFLSQRFQSRPIIAALLGLLLSPIGMLYVRRFWAAFGIFMGIVIYAIISIFGRLDFNIVIGLYIAYSVSMAIWAFLRASKMEFAAEPSIVFIPLIIVILGTIAFSTVTLPYNAQLQYDIMKKSTTIPAEAKENMRENAANPKYGSAVISSYFVAVLPAAIMALIAWGVGSFVFGGEAEYHSIFGVTLMGGLITVLGNLLKAPLMILKDTALVSIGPAALFPDKGPTSLFFMLLLFLDVFAIWGIIVTGIGYGKAFKISQGGGIITSVIASFVIIVIYIGMQMIGMTFAGVETTWF